MSQNYEAHRFPDCILMLNFNTQLEWPQTEFAYYFMITYMFYLISIQGKEIHWERFLNNMDMGGYIRFLNYCNLQEDMAKIH